MTRSHSDRRRGPATIGGYAAVLALVGILALWISGVADPGLLPVGPILAYALLVAMIAVVVVGTWIVQRRPVVGLGVRVSVAFGITLLGVLAGVLALFVVFRREDPIDLVLGLLLAVALMASNLVAGQVAREVREGVGRDPGAPGPTT